MDRQSCWLAAGYRSLNSARLLRVACLGLVFLGGPYVASATTTASMSITGFLNTCGMDSPLLNESSPVFVSDGLGPVTMQCDFATTDIASIHAQARAHPDGAPDIAVVASSTGVGASATVRATYDDFATISPPLGLSALDATLSVTSPYFLSLSLPDGSSGVASITLTVALYASLENHITTAGDSSGTLNTGEITVPNCPCTIEILGAVSVQGANGGGGSAKDPFTINLPEGWTYTLASEQQAQASAVPGPGSLVMVGSVLAAGGIGRLWQVRRTRSLSC